MLFFSFLPLLTLVLSSWYPQVLTIRPLWLVCWGSCYRATSSWCPTKPSCLCMNVWVSLRWRITFSYYPRNGMAQALLTGAQLPGSLRLTLWMCKEPPSILSLCVYMCVLNVWLKLYCGIKKCNNILWGFCTQHVWKQPGMETHQCARLLLNCKHAFMRLKGPTVKHRYKINTTLFFSLTEKHAQSQCSAFLLEALENSSLFYRLKRALERERDQICVGCLKHLVSRGGGESQQNTIKRRRKNVFFALIESQSQTRFLEYLEFEVKYLHRKLPII